jgi:hypothetical protein
MTTGINCRDSDGYQNTEACVYRAQETLGIVPQVQKNTFFRINHAKKHAGSS